MSQIIQDIEELALKLAETVSERVKSVLDGREPLEISFKAENDVVTEVDVWAERVITESIQQSFPDHTVLGEESAWAEEQDAADFAKGFCWIVDPIDGTSNFVNRIPHVGISIGVLENGVRKVGVVQDVGRDLVYSAVKGQGAKLNGQSIKAASSKELRKSLIAVGYPHSRIKDWPKLEPAYQAFFEKARDVRTLGCAALEQCWVASGKLEAYFEMGLRPWDVAAGALIIEEGGGLIGNPIDGQEEFSCFSTSFLFACTEEIYRNLSSQLPESL